MEALIVEAAAYLLVLPLRALGLVGGRRVRERTRRAEWWILRQAWRIGASGVTTNTETGGGFSEDAWRSAAVLKFEEEAKLNLERTTPELEGGRRRVEGRDAGGGGRSAEMREAMLEAQRRQAQGRRSARGLRRSWKRRRRG